MVTQSLYEIAQEYLNLIAILEENEGLLDIELELRLAINKDNFNEKMNNYAKVIQMQKAKLKFAESEIERIEKYKKSVDNSINRLEKTLLNSLQLFGQKDKEKDIWRVETDTFKFSTRKSNSVNVFNEEQLPSDCFNYKLKSNLDENDVNNIKAIDNSLVFDKVVSKTIIKDKIESGEIINGARIEEKYSIVLK